MADIFAVEGGRGPGEPVVLLHGFGLSHRSFDALRPPIEARRRVIAFDLPGHAGSLQVGRIGGAGVAAKAVLEALQARGHARWHLVGHSLGGAAAALAALRAPAACASLTLLAPGGFGPQINARLLRRYAAASDEAGIAQALESFFGWRHEIPAGLPRRLAAERAVPGAREALAKILETLFVDGRQGEIPVDDLARLDAPVKVVWGRDDMVLPYRQALSLPGRIGVHVFDGVGHMLADEIPQELARLVLENTRPDAP